MTANAKTKPVLRPAYEKALRDFDQLPGSAEVPVQVVAARFTVSPVTIWRWAAQGKISRPIRRGGVTRWNVGDLRQCEAR